MAKIRIRDSKAPTGNATDKPENLKKQCKKKKKKKKRFFWKNKTKLAEQKVQKSPSVASGLPPKTPQEVSSNWKGLQELLKQKAASLDSAVTELDTCSKKKHATKEEGTGPRLAEVNGAENRLKCRPVENTKKGRTESLVHPALPKSKRSAHGRNLSQAQKDKKECKGGKRNNQVERDYGDIKHKRRKPEELPDIWFDDVDPDDIEAALGSEAAEIARKQLGSPRKQLGSEEKAQPLKEQTLVKEKAFEGLTRAVAMDCEMVGVGPNGEDSIVARVSLVNQFGKCVYDKYVKAAEKVMDYRTAVSGIRPENLKTGEDFKVVQKEVADILKGRILVGHALHNDLKVLFLDHPKKKIRDTQRYKPFRQKVKSVRPSLKLLCEKLLNVKVQRSEHSSIQDAQAAMRLYVMVKKQWEASLKTRSKTERK
ncbi:RNA exonuclease 4 [Eublepharis macularius]|uniref:RNA exonuclease 4 n=1 Tax=Eublepharis macularius TaxID=481883 RepID=A0AA97LER8_EUBMA|nr:RNA exonuclease 4 [Eublepharis macularius]XP_054853114.1 RNA exonuclease 4 [Eublepharis macularius]XP_054853115.1 RNA exonuclease 4 [Eublepharis macularius]